MSNEYDPYAIPGVESHGGAAASERAKRKPAKATPVANETEQQLRSYVERIERLEEEKKETADFIKDVYGEAKSSGFNPKILKKVIALRKMDEQKRLEEDLVLDNYLLALGMLPDA